MHRELLVLWVDGRPHFWHEDFDFLLVLALTHYSDFRIITNETEVILRYARLHSGTTAS